MEASDNDQEGTVNTQLSFFLTNSSSPFSIDEATGNITVGQGLTTGNHTVEVGVRDSGLDPLSSTGLFEVEVVNQNQFAPAFDQDNYTVMFFENSVPSDAVLSFTVPDSDTTSDEMTVSVSLLQSEFSGSFSVNETGGGFSLFLLNAFDREDTSTFTLSLLAVDQGPEPFRRSSQALVLVQVNDTNDNAPVLRTAADTVSVNENQQVREVIFQANASDADTGVNAELFYQLQDSFDNAFAIDNSSGEVSIAGELHRLTTPRYDLVVTVYDLGGATPNSLSDSLNLTVLVLEVNGFPPVFAQGMPVSATIPEDTAVPHSLLNISVSDEDGGLSGAVSLALVQNGALFALDNYTLLLNSPVDLEVSKEEYG